MVRAILLAACTSVGFGVASATYASTIAVSGGVGIATGLRDCRSSPTLSLPDRCFGPSPDFSGTLRPSPSDVSAGLAAGAFVTNPLGISSLGRTGGVAVRSATDTETPFISFGAFTSLPYARATAFGTAIQGYSWDGTGPVDRTFDADMTFTSTDPRDFNSPDSAPGPYSIGSLAVTIFSLATPTFDAHDTQEPLPGGDACFLGTFDPDTCLGGRSDYQQLTFNQVFAGPGTSPLSVSLDFSLDASRYTFVDVFVQTAARFGASFDAQSTVVTSFDSLQGLTPLAAWVPEPSTLPLVGLTLATVFVASACRKRRGSPARSRGRSLR